MTSARLLPSRGALTIGAAGAVGAVLLVAGAVLVGPVGALAGLCGLVALVLLRHPGLAVAALVCVTVVAESDEGSVLGQTAVLYDVAAFFTPAELLLGLAAVSVGLQLVAQHRPLRLPSPFTPVLVLTLIAIAAGVVSGYYGGATAGDLRSGVRTPLLIVVVPFLVVQVVRTPRDARLAVGLLAGLAIFKALEGLAAVAAGIGVKVDGQTITYYEPTGNWVMMLFLLVVAAALLLGRRASRLPTWILATWPVVLLALILSFRRSFWIAVVLGLALVIVLGAGRTGRRMLVPAGAMLAGAVWMMSSFASFDLSGPLGQRVESLNPAKVRASADDRYRLDERANVLRELRRQPISGLGFEVPWRATQPLPVEHDNGRRYVHFAALWWWMKMGILGLVAWVGLVGTALWSAYTVSRRQADPLLRAVGLGALCALLGLIVIELTTTFTGADVRFTLAFAAGLGLLSSLVQIGRHPSPESPG